MSSRRSWHYLGHASGGGPGCSGVWSVHIARPLNSVWKYVISTSGEEEELEFSDDKSAAEYLRYESCLDLEEVVETLGRIRGFKTLARLLSDA